LIKLPPQSFGRRISEIRTQKKPLSNLCVSKQQLALQLNGSICNYC
jgi:hypothetical protein